MRPKVSAKDYGGMSNTQDSQRFPEGFLWGAATSSHQVEGGNRLNDWWYWEQEGRVREKSGDACRQYELFRNDLDIAQSLHHNAHRLSIEWSRVEPEPGKWNEEAIRHYQEVIAAVRERGMEPVVTLHHFTNPMWLFKLGGWTSDECIYHFERYTNKMAQALGPQVRYWLTINEPLIYIYIGHIIGEWPPGEKSPQSALKVFKNFLLGHQHAYRVLHGVYREKGWQKPMVSFAQHVAYHAPCSPWSVKDWFSTYIRHIFFTRLPFEAMLRGYLFFPGIFAEKLPMKGCLDFIGINYYTREFIHFDKLSFPEIFGDMCSMKHHKDIAKRNDMGWESYPEGLYHTLLEVKRYNLPILITENGTCTPDDRDRWDFILAHVQKIRQAMKRGANVIGYLYWSLLDNFEWARGFDPRFGLVEVDYKTQSRKVRESAVKYGNVCRENSLPI